LPSERRGRDRDPSPPELVELLGFAVPRDLFPVFGPGEQSKEDSAEDDAGNRGFIFGEQVDQRVISRTR